MGSQQDIKTVYTLSTANEISLDEARVAVFNALLARRYDCPFLIYVDDLTQSATSVEVSELLDDLRWLGLRWQEGVNTGSDSGPFQRSERRSIYDAFYVKLQELDLAYPCYCKTQANESTHKRQLAAGETPYYAGPCGNLSELDQHKNNASGLPSTLRLRVQASDRLTFDDLVLGKQTFHYGRNGDFIIRQQGKALTSAFSNVIDDALMAVTHRIVPVEQMLRFPQQTAIANALGLPITDYGHLPALRRDATRPTAPVNISLRQLRLTGYQPLAVLNYLARLGHYYLSNELLSFDQLAEQFHLKRMSRSAVQHSHQQLDHWQQEAQKKQLQHSSSV
jgi:glutamyl-tRNA synthetase